MPQTSSPTSFPRRALWQLVVCLAALISSSVTQAQFASVAPPEPIYWKQNLLTVPYQWTGGANGSAPKSVWLYVSKDRGVTWNRIGDAQPQLLAFNYRAEADGEYWFAIRTTDASGRDTRLVAVPGSAAAIQPELRVIVDTTMPRFASLSSALRSDGTLEVRWRVVDANLQAHSCNVELQQDAAGDWKPVPLTSASEAGLGVWDGLATVQVALGQRPTAVRATVVDLAGNRAIYQSAVTAAPTADVVTAGSGNASSGSIPSITPHVDAAPGWVSNSAPPLADLSLNGPAQSQLWPADHSAGFTNVVSGDSGSPSVPAITYGAPLGVGAASPPLLASEDGTSNIPAPRSDDRPLGNVPAQRDQPFAPLEPFRQVSMARTSTADDANTPISVAAAPVEPDSPPVAKLVNSRTFALEYELAEVGENGVSKVELWGTRDGGDSWQSYAVDDDNRSPLSVTVDGEGEYGFRIVVEGAGGLGEFPPQPGDKPELLVRVDLEPPQAQITSVDADLHSAARQLVVRWDVEDDNLESRPVSLFYSSRPAGPWTPITSSLENVGEYNWPLERHVPRRLYLKLEARDTAGNVAVYQSTEPFTVESKPSVARVQRLPPLDDSIRPLP